jgi:hypothetical protein
MLAEHQEYVAACEKLEEIVQHVTDNTLERYAMRTLPRHKIGPLEEHLLICSDCRNRLEAEIDIATALHVVATKVREDEGRENGIVARATGVGHQR